MGVWIETRKIFGRNKLYYVTPCMGVWIETTIASFSIKTVIVTPCMGVWIETGKEHHQENKL